jgi:hypothetical protein
MAKYQYRDMVMQSDHASMTTNLTTTTANAGRRR